MRKIPTQGAWKIYLFYSVLLLDDYLKLSTKLQQDKKNLRKCYVLTKLLYLKLFYRIEFEVFPLWDVWVGVLGSRNNWKALKRNLEGDMTEFNVFLGLLPLPLLPGKIGPSSSKLYQLIKTAACAFYRENQKKVNFFLMGDILGFFMYCIQHSFICRPSDSTVSEDAGVEPRTLATTALAVRRSNHSAKYHPI